MPRFRLDCVNICAVWSKNSAALKTLKKRRFLTTSILLHLAPDIQEAILFMPCAELGRDSITERELRPIAAVPDWKKQRRMWHKVAQRSD